MKLEYTLDENDYLTNFLFGASRSERIKKRRNQVRWAIPIFYTILGLSILQNKKFVSFAILLLIAVLWTAFYPSYSRRFYIKHYKRYIAEQYHSNIKRPATLEINSDHLFTRDSGSESRIATSEIQEINDISNLILLKIGPQNTIIPKHKITEPDKVVKELKDLAAQLSIKYNEQPGWKWQ